jgi:hypothetical protein
MYFERQRSLEGDNDAEILLPEDSDNNTILSHSGLRKSYTAYTYKTSVKVRKFNKCIVLPSIQGCMT